MIGLSPAWRKRACGNSRSIPDANAIVGNAWLVGPDGQAVIRLFEQNRVVGWPDILTHNPYGALCAIMVRRTAIEAVGGLAADSMPGCEDWDLWVRMARCGMKFIPVEATLGRYRQTPLSYSRRALTMLQSSCKLLSRCAETDPRLGKYAGSITPPISAQTGERLRNARVLYFLGVALAAGGKTDTLKEILEMLVPGAFDPALAMEQFAWGIEYGQLARGVNPLRVSMKKEKLIALTASRLHETGLAHLSNGIAIQLRESIRNLIESRSLLMRAWNRLH